MEISDQQFKGRNDFTSVIFPSTLRRIGKDAFHGCHKLKCVLRIPASVEIIDDGAFQDCTSITGLVFERGSDKNK